MIFFFARGLDGKIVLIPLPSLIKNKIKNRSFVLYLFLNMYRYIIHPDRLTSPVQFEKRSKTTHHEDQTLINLAPVNTGRTLLHIRIQ